MQNPFILDKQPAKVCPHFKISLLNSLVVQRVGDLGRRLCGGEEPGEGEGVSLVMVGEEHETSGGGEEREGTKCQVLRG